MLMDTILLDMDEVLVDFVGGACKVHNKDPLVVAEIRRQRRVYWLHTLWGISAREFWEPIDKLGVSFWQTLAPLPWFEEVLELFDPARSGMNLYIVTCPNGSADCLLGKSLWLQRHVSKELRERTVYTRFKCLLSNDHTYLIDDAPHNIRNFNRFGGRGVLFPNDGNCLWPLLETGTTRHYLKSMVYTESLKGETDAPEI